MQITSFSLTGNPETSQYLERSHHPVCLQCSQSPHFFSQVLFWLIFLFEFFFFDCAIQAVPDKDDVIVFVNVAIY
jgi:hypothetical protein